MGERLRKLGIRLAEARSTALFQLATELPAAVLARTLGIDITVAVKMAATPPATGAPTRPRSAAATRTSESKDKGATQVLLRDVEYGDVDAYVQMRCDPVMMAELGGPLPREGMEAKVRRDVQQVAADIDWTKMIVPDEAELDVVAGTVTLWPHDADGERISEIGWMVLPEYQGQGLGKQGVRRLLELARDDGRWGLIHAFPATTNAPSNGICRTLGFRFLGKQDVPFAGRVLQTNHWAIDPRTDLT
ncbi:RimJ/RimL family protein N-acetyltransferase [Streptomyces tendae]